MTIRTWLDAAALGVVLTLAALVWSAMLAPLPALHSERAQMLQDRAKHFAVHAQRMPAHERAR